MNTARYLIFLSALFLLSCTHFKKTKTDRNLNTRVIISTEYGDVKIRLYDETPRHRDNFISLVQNKTLDSTTFHRVIKNFMIQGGDPDSKKAIAGVPLGEGSVGYTLPAEIRPGLYHKRGALAAARESDIINPEMESSGSQFYIVHGTVFTDTMLYDVSTRVTYMYAYNKVVNSPENKALMERVRKAFDTQNQDSAMILSSRIDAKAKEMAAAMTRYKFSDEQRKTYTTVGGAPHLDGTYTVFGEVEEGMEVIDKIASVPVNQRNNHRPLKDIRMTVRLVKEKK